MNAQWCLIRVAKVVLLSIALSLPSNCFPAEEEEYRPDMEIVAGKLNPSPEVIRQASRFPPKAAIGFFLNIMSNGTPEAREIARTTLIEYPGWQDRFDRGLSEAVEFWKANQVKQVIRRFDGKDVEVLADGNGASNARNKAERTFYTLARIKHPSVIPIIAKHLDADGETYWREEEEVRPLNWDAAGALTDLVRAGVSIPGAPRVDKKLVVDEWKEWWRTHQHLYETAAVPEPTATPQPPTVPSATPAPQQAKSAESTQPPPANNPAPAESGWSAATLALIAGLALMASLVVLVVFVRGRRKLDTT